MACLFQRGKRYYLKYYVAGRQKEKSLGTDVYQIAKERQRQFESAQASGTDDPLPARTPVGELPPEPILIRPRDHQPPNIKI